MKPVFILTFFVQLSFGQPTTYHIDNTHSTLEFSIPFMSITEVGGRFDRFCGTFEHSVADPAKSKIEVYIDAGSITTGLEIRDRDLRKNFFDVENFPIISFRSKRTIPISEKRLEVVGDLFVRGASHEVKISMTILGSRTNNDGTKEIGVKLLELPLSRSQLNITSGSGAGVTLGDTASVSGFIRLREFNQMKLSFAADHPEKQADHLMPFTDSFGNPEKTEQITLLKGVGKFFVAMNGKNWQWLSVAVPIGVDNFRLVSFSTTIRVVDGALHYSDGKNENPIVYSKMLEE
ncbi:MAG TPA: YceI family protein [Chryseosolibacter sp.]|nr:YceI family protein [Chryseosolibacter sp.]